MAEVLRFRAGPGRILHHSFIGRHPVADEDTTGFKR